MNKINFGKDQIQHIFDINEKGDNFWTDDYTILWENDNYTKIIPSKKMTKNEKYNAFTRLIILHIIIILVFNLNKKYIVIDVILLVAIILVNNKNKNDKEKLLRKSTIINPYMNLPFNNNIDEMNKPSYDLNNNILNNFTYNSNYNPHDIVNDNYSNINFYTLPVNTYPNDNQMIFKQKNINKNCKYDNNCLLYSDLRYK